jgi:hypothetical protein
VIYAILALVVVDTLICGMQMVLMVEMRREQQWDRLVLIPWINAINTKLGLPK